MSEAHSASIASPALYPGAPVLSLQAQRVALKAWLVATDALFLCAAFLGAYWMRFDLQVTTAPEVVPWPYFYPMLAALLAPVSILIFHFFKLYDLDSLLGGVSEYSKIFNASNMVAMMVVLTTFLVPQFTVSRIWLVSAWVLSFVLVAANRFIARRMVYPMRRRGYFLTPAVIVGTNQEAATLAADLSDWRSSGLRIAGFVSNTPGADSRPGLPVLGDVKDIRTIIDDHGIEDLVVAITALDREELLELCEEVNSVSGVHLRLSSGLYELLTTGLTVQTRGNVPLVSLNKVRLDAEEVMIKTLLEYTLVAVGLLVLWPLLLVIALLIKLDSRGSVFYRRRVLGVSGKQFDAFKFRTMQVDGDDLIGSNTDLQQQLRANHKLKQDPRVTRLGHWLRKYSLDELPQLFNVIRGEMGLVGPRMITAAEAEKYGRHRLNLLTVKPGITGLWQVSGRSDLTYDERVNLDMYYIRNYSVWLDLQILFVQTVPAVIQGKGAYLERSMRILFLSRWFPYPPDNGSKLRVFGLLRGLCERHDVTLISFRNPAEAAGAVPAPGPSAIHVCPYREFAPASGRAMLGFLSDRPRYLVDTYSPEMDGLIRQTIRDTSFDLVIASQLPMAAYFESFRGIPAIFEEVELGIYRPEQHRVELAWARMRRSVTWAKHTRFMARLLKNFAACTVASDIERRLMAAAVPGYRAVHVIPNSVPGEPVDAPVAPRVPDTLIFTGSLQYGPNQDAMSWFLDEVFPLVRATVPGVRLTITGDVGSTPPRVGPDVVLTGRVPDVRSLVASSAVSLAPIRAGGGTRLKILEAMALGTPVVATSKAVEGIDAHDGEHLLIADTPRQFADAVHRLLADPAAARTMAERARVLFQRRYDTRVVVPEFLRLVEHAVAA